MCAAYSSLGLTKELYATSLVQKPSSCEGNLGSLEEISEMCWPQSILSVMVIPRYFAD